jgi:tetratricopeptide (TPR) repeat protein
VELACKSCGASGRDVSPRGSFVCKYCGTTNVDEKFFKEYASHLDLGKANRLLQRGLTHFDSGDYERAEQHLEASILEDDGNPETWVYLAICKAHTLQVSQFVGRCRTAASCLQRAVDIDGSAEVVQAGKVLVANLLLASSVKSAVYYFDNAEKKFVAFSNPAITFDEALNGFEMLDVGRELNPTDSELLASASVVALGAILHLERHKVQPQLISERKELYLEQLLTLYDHRPDVVNDAVSKHPSVGGKIQSLLLSRRTQSSAIVPSDKSSKYTVHALIVIGLIVVVIVLFTKSCA